MNTSQALPQNRLSVLDLVRGLSIFIIICYHFLQEFFYTAFLIVPEGISTNLSRLQLFHGTDFFTNSVAILKSLFTSLFAYGFASVNVFILLSGFVLTWGLLKNKNPQPTNWLLFYYKKLKRIFIPLFFAVIATFSLLSFRNHFFPEYSWWPSYQLFDYLKFLLPPFYFFDFPWIQQLEGAYWYIPIILQFYLIFPVLFLLLKKIGSTRFILTTLILTIVYRFFATYGFQIFHLSFFDTYPMGIISQAQNSYYGFCFFLPRLFEFSLGMGIASIEHSKPGTLQKFIGRIPTLLSIFISLLSFCCLYYRPGWLISDPILAIGLSILFLNIATYLQSHNLTNKLFTLIGDCSYEVYLLHHPILNFVILPTLMVFSLRNETGFWLFFPFYLLVIILISHYVYKFLNLLQKKA